MINDNRIEEGAKCNQTETSEIINLSAAEGIFTVNEGYS